MVTQVVGFLQQISQSNMPRVHSFSALESASCPQLDDGHERLRCLMLQEEQHYLCEDYMHQQKNGDYDESDSKDSDSMSSMKAEQCARIVSDLAFSSPCADDTMNPAYPSSVCVRDLADSQARAAFVADERSAATPKLVGFWRQQMLEWSNLVIDSFGIDREVVAVSFNVLDRYVAQEIKSSIPITREDFQLFSMTALFIAVKLLESYPRKLTADALVDMSRGFYASEDILHTEREILKSLQFYLNPTTAIGFCRVYWEMFPMSVSFEFKAACQAMAERALADTFFLTKKASLVGLAAVIHASRIEGYRTAVMDQFLLELQDTINVHGCDEFEAIYQRLELLSHN